MSEKTEVQSDLNTILPFDPTITVNDEVITVKQIKMKQFNQILQLAAPVISVIRDNSKMLKNESDLRSLISQLYLANPQELCKLVGVCVNKPLEWVEDLDLGQMMNLTMKIVEVNLDFFIENLLPSLLGVLSRLKQNPAALAALAKVTGQMKSSISSVEDTDSSISSNTATASS